MTALGNAGEGRMACGNTTALSKIKVAAFFASDLRNRFRCQATRKTAVINSVVPPMYSYRLITTVNQGRNIKPNERVCRNHLNVCRCISAIGQLMVEHKNPII